jgi:dTDP-4-dehydrorhamnose 3,5-epimerase
MKFIRTEIPDVILIEPRVFADERGFFMETRQMQKFAEVGISLPFLQDNHTSSKHGVLRGLHYQRNNPQGKLVRVVQGEVFDVAVDLRKNSATFGRWVGVYLSAKNRNIFWVPPGFAHGFYVVSASADFLYSCTDYYSPGGDERCIIWNDPDLAITWPLAKNRHPELSPKDAEGVLFKNADYYEAGIKGAICV